jgi:nucleoid DNA-binding protein
MSQALINEIKEQGGALGTNAAAKQAVEVVTRAIRSLANRNEKVTIRDFGTFKVQHRAARTGRNPRTGEPLPIAAKDVLTFKASGQA